jgi:Domain of unknown function (DUF4440)
VRTSAVFDRRVTRVAGRLMPGVLVVIALSVTPVRSQAQSAASAPVALADSLLELVRLWGQAYVVGDRDFAEAFIADDWVGWLDDHADDKASALAGVRTGPARVSENIVDQATVRIFGTTAVIQARERNHVRDSAGGHWVTRHITDVLVQREGRWVVVASHDSRIPNPPE